MDTSIIIALIGVGSSIVISIVSAAFTFRNQRRVELIKAEVLKNKSIQDARLGYEFEARKNLYQQLEPLKFQLLESVELAIGRIKGIAKSTQNGEMNASIWGNINNYYFHESLYKLFSPICLFNQMKRKMTFVDIKLDQDLFIQYSLLKILYYSFQQEFKIAEEKDTDHNKDYVERWKKQYLNPSPDFKREGIPSYYLDRLSKAFLIEENGINRLLDYEEYEQKINDQDKKTLKFLESGEKLLKNFEIKTHPILWTLFVCHACIYHILIKIRDNPGVTYHEIKKYTNEFFEDWKERYAIPEELENEIESAKYARKYLEKQFKKHLKGYDLNH